MGDYVTYVTPTPPQFLYAFVSSLTYTVNDFSKSHL